MPNLDELFDNYERYAWRLEARDVYAVASQAQVTEWLAGRQHPQDADAQQWYRMLKPTLSRANQPLASG